MTSTANAFLSFMSAEALSLVEQAKKYRAMMEHLKADDPNRAIYADIIRDLLERSRRISTFTRCLSK
ncbi:MAG: hypothetical protein Q8P46_03785 [Hyphomicrobiales bacterium]|nr:hypothetical protein [Hyphomicrobiales bacterium]